MSKTEGNEILLTGAAMDSYIKKRFPNYVPSVAPPRPKYDKCNAGHTLMLMENERGQMVWDCQTCIDKMRGE